MVPPRVWEARGKRELCLGLRVLKSPARRSGAIVP